MDNNKKNFKSKKFFIILIAGLVVFSGVVFAGIKAMQKMNKVTTCMVQFESSGGTKVDSQEVEKGLNAEKPEKPVKEGFTFIEWQLNGETYNFDSIVTEDIMLVAKWEAKENILIIKVHFDTDGGTEVNDIEIAKGTLLIPPLEPLKTGYTFTGWYLGEQRFDFTKKIEEEITLKATWAEKETIETNKNVHTDINNSLGSNNEIISNLECKYTKKDDEYEGTPTWVFGIGEETLLSYSFGYWDYSSDTCRIAYRTDDSSILSISPSGVAVGQKAGTTCFYVCVVNKSTNEELDSFKWNAIVQYTAGSDKATEVSKNLLKSLNGYYWYLDGYEFAYLYPSVNDWYDHQSLTWESEYIEIVNNEFVTTEKTGIIYTFSSNIHNKFLCNPAEEAYMLIEDYNMSVSGNKLYITLGGRTYSFTKYNSKKNVTGSLSLNKSSITINKGDTDSSIIVKISPFFANCDVIAISSDNSRVQCSVSSSDEGVFIINCFAFSPGNATITVKDTISENIQTVNVSITDKIINANGISLNKTSLSLIKGNSETLISTIAPNNTTNKNVTWTSNNTAVAKVNSNGVVTAIGAGTATITVKSEDGGYTASCTVTVANPPLTVDASMGISSKFTDTGVLSGIFVEANPSGGTGSYTYNIKLYYEGSLIGEGSSNELFVNQISNGTYSATISVTDSNGTTETITKTMTKS